MINIKYLIPSFINHGNFSLPRCYHKVALKKSLNETSLIFVASTGREGSGYIADIFKDKPNTISFHECRPFCNGESLINDSLSNNFKKTKILKKKFITIASLIRKSHAKIYVESNHMFLKTFGKFFVREFDTKFNLISLRRPIIKTVISFQELNWFGKRYSRARNWIYKIKDNTTLNSKKLVLKTEVDQIMAYILNEKLNEVAFKNSAAGKINYVRFNIPPSKQEIDQLFLDLNIKNNNDIKITKSNARDSKKIFSADIIQTENLILSFFDANEKYLSEKGIKFLKNRSSFIIEDEIWSLI